MDIQYGYIYGYSIWIYTWIFDMDIYIWIFNMDIYMDIQYGAEPNPIDRTVCDGAATCGATVSANARRGQAAVEWSAHQGAAALGAYGAVLSFWFSRGARWSSPCRGDY
eukprot:SAG11_NODE_2049_length_3883_cov_5.318446_3_plen_109_part_00